MSEEIQGMTEPSEADRQARMECDKCGGSGVIETGNNDFPCSCPAGDVALFNHAAVPGHAITGKEVKLHYLNSSPEPRW